MSLLLALKFWREIAIAVLAILVIVILSLYASRGAAIKQIKTDHELELTTLKANYVETARDIERKAYEQTIQAVNEAKKREQIIIADAANTTAVNERLSQTIDRLSITAATDAAFRVKYTDTIGQSLKDCSSSITDLARQADGYTNDIRLLQQANKRK